MDIKSWPIIIAQIRGLITRPNFIIECYTKYDCGYGKTCESGNCVGKLQLDEKNV